MRWFSALFRSRGLANPAVIVPVIRLRANKLQWALLLLLSAATITRADGTFDLVDYYHRLPESYRNYYADIANGYLAVTARELAEPLFEMALFRADDGTALLVTCALQRDPVCSRYEGFVLRYDPSARSMVSMKRSSSFARAAVVLRTQSSAITACIVPPCGSA